MHTPPAAPFPEANSRAGNPAEVVLCVDDEPALLALLEATLSIHRYKTVTVNDAQEALRLIHTRPFHAVILDHHMPGMKGAELATHIKRVQPAAAIIMFSGSLNAAAGAHVDSYIAKGGGMGTLISELRRLLDKSWAGQKQPRKFPRYPVQFSLAVGVNRDSHSAAMLSGVCTTISEGGVGGIVEGELEPGQVVQMEIVDATARMALHTRAEVRYRDRQRYGFEFRDFSLVEVAELRRVCQQLAGAHDLT